MGTKVTQVNISTTDREFDLRKTCFYELNFGSLGCVGSGLGRPSQPPPEELKWDVHGKPKLYL